MPFKSKAQRRWMYANHPEMAKEWEEHTTKGSKLPEHVKKSSMNTQQAYIEGFVKRAAQYGYKRGEAISLFKQAAMAKAPVPEVPQTQPANISLGNINPQQPINTGSNIVNPTNFGMDDLASHFQNQGRFNSMSKAVTGETPFPTSQQAGNYLGNTSKINQMEQGVKAITPPPAVPASPSDRQMVTAPPSAGGQSVYSNKASRGVYTPSAADFKRIMGSYDPRSRMDREKADVIHQMYQPGMNLQDIYKHPAYINAGRRA